VKCLIYFLFAIERVYLCVFATLLFTGQLHSISVFISLLRFSVYSPFPRASYCKLQKIGKFLSVLFLLFVSRRKICFILGISFVSMIYDRKQSGDLALDYGNEFFYLNIQFSQRDMRGFE